jgi:hypothetical protein
MTTQFKIAQLDRNTANGFVTTVHWTASQVDGEHTSGTYGSIGFQESEGTMIPYPNLTEATVIEWVKASLGADGVAAIDASLSAQIAEQKAPTTATGVPWQ